MRVAQSAHDLRDEMQRLAPVELASALHILLERDAVDQLHDDILGLAAGHVVDRDDIRVREHGDRLRLVPEAAAELRVLRKLAAEDLDRDGTVQPAVRRAIDRRHAAASEHVVNLVAVVKQLADHVIHR